MKYRREIDGLRAVAVIPVIFFHAGFTFFSGGYVGVDIFFVISGYLITSIIISELEQGTFSILRFYERRARRILPALFFVMLLCIPFAWMWMLPSQFKDFSQSLVAVSVFASNVLFWRESGYFEAASEEKPLLHTWSLAVEEQYYMLFPIFLILLWRFGRSPVFYSIIAISIISLLLSEWGWRNSPTGNFYLAPTRAWELLAGSICAFLQLNKMQKSNNALSALGLALIVFAIFFYDDSTPFPSVYALAPVVGTALIIMYGARETWVAQLLSLRGFVGIGLISYSAYLWHQPLFAFARIRSIYAPEQWLMLVLAVASLALAYISWRYIELPFRKRTAPTIQSQRAIFSMASIVGTAFIAYGLFGHQQNGFEQKWIDRQPFSLQNTYRVIAAAQNKPEEIDGVYLKQDNGDCRFNVPNIVSNISERIVECYSKYGSGVAILGDSHAIGLFGVVISQSDDDFIIGITKGGCRPHTPAPNCHYVGFFDFIKANPAVFSNVIYEQAGFYLVRNSNEPAGRKTFNQIPLYGEVTGIFPNGNFINAVYEYLTKVSNYVPVLWFGSRVEPHIIKNDMLRLGCDYDYSLRKNQYNVFIELDEAISQIANLPSTVSFLSQNEVFGYDFSTDFMNCDQLFWSDGDHLSASGEIRFGQRFNLIDYVNNGL